MKIRRILHLLLAVLLVVIMTAVRASALPTFVLAETSVNLTHGPVIGAVTANSAQVFVRTASDAQVKIRYSASESLATFTDSPSMHTSAEHDWTAQISLTGLESRTNYYVGVVVDDVLQAGGRGQFKTFPTVGIKGKIRFVMLTDFGSLGEGLQLPLTDPSPVFGLAAAENPDFVFIGGDFDHRNPRTLDDKRQMFKDLYALNNPRAPTNDFVTKILSRFPLAHQWDDHDFAGNDSNRFALDRFLAKQAYTEYFPAYPYGGASGIYQKFTYGNADFFVLDERSQRDPNEMPDSPTKSMLDGEHLGSAGQLAWLMEGLKNSKATWKIIFSSSVFNPTIGKADSWQSFQTEHDSLVNFVKTNKIGGVIVLSGDIHAGAMDDGQNAGLPQVVVPGVNLKLCSALPQHAVGKWSNGFYGDTARKDTDSPCNGYAVVNLKQPRAILRVKDETGKTRLRLKLTAKP